MEAADGLSAEELRAGRSRSKGTVTGEMIRTGKAEGLATELEERTGVLMITQVDPRAAAGLGGRAEISSTPGAGTKVQVVLPG